MAPDDAELLDLALSIVDGSDVEWSADDSGSVAERLRELEKIAAFHRSLGGDAATERWGQLEILESLGAGSRGEVWRAWDPQLKRQVALKVLRAGKEGRPELLDALLTEGEMTARVRHENIVTIHSVERHGDAVGLSMELIEGSTLLQIVEAQGPMSAPEATLIGRQLCGALGAIHGARVVHRDVKAQNVMRQVGGRIVLMDFSSGATYGPPSAPDQRFATSGTPLYMAPELLEGRSATPASDVYALGVLLFFLTTGTFPITASSLDELRSAHHLRRRRLLRDVRPDLPSEFVDAVEAAIDPDPANRPSSAGALERRLAPAAGVPAAPPHGPRATVPWWNRLGRTTWWAAAAIVVVGAALLAFRPWQGPSTGADFQVEVKLYRTHAGTTTEVKDGDRFALGDTLQMTYRAGVPSWLYIVDEDDSGWLMLLYPPHGAAARSALTAGVEHHIPRDDAGRPAGWPLKWAGGRDHLLFIASPRRLVELEAVLLALDVPRSEGSAGGSPDAALHAKAARARLRGFGTVVSIPGPEGSSAEPRFVADTYESLVSGPTRVRGVWARRVVLDGPQR